MAKSTTSVPTIRNLNELDAWRLPSLELDRLLATGDDLRLRSLFGDDYEELRELARQSQRTARSDKRRVVLVPGILGSTLGKPGTLFTQDTIWFDPVSIRRGDVAKLALGTSGQTSLQSLDVVPVVHVYLRLRLMSLGYSVEYFHYDWRQSIGELGKRLRDHLAQLPGPVDIVAHSMGGLVTRAALKLGTTRVRRAVMLGTPNRGSFSPVEVLQGINSNVVLVDKLDPHHTAEELTRAVFSTFPSVYEMLPRPEVFDKLDLFRADSWPQTPLRPSAERLRAAQATWPKLADEDPRLFLIAGHGQPTVTDLSRGAAGAFVYHQTEDGDGTVPLSMCLLPSLTNSRTWFVPESHTGLLRNESVAKGVADLLETGQTARLPASLAGVRNLPTEVILQHEDFLDRGPRPRLLGGRSGAAIDPRDLPLILETAMAGSSLPAEKAIASVQRRRAANRVPGVAGGTSAVDNAGAARLTSGILFNHTVISRDHQHQLDVELYHGSLFDAPYRAIVLGIFSDVDPEGPAKTLDALTHGAVTELMSRRMFDAAAGKVFVMPTGRNALKADYVVFAGLGEYSQFAASPSTVLQTISCNVLRTLMNCGVDEFATLIYGGASGLSIRGSVDSFVRGYLEALEALGANQRSIQFRRVALCEMSPERYAELKDEAYRMGGTELCRNVRLRLNEAKFPAVTQDIERGFLDRTQRLLARRPPSTVYLTTRFERSLSRNSRAEPDRWKMHASLLGAGAKATIFPSVKEVSRTELDDLLAQLPNGNSTVPAKQLLAIGRAIRDLVFTEDFVQVLLHDLTTEDHLAIIVDEGATRIPWELLPMLGSAPGASLPPSHDQLACVHGGVSRRFQTDGSLALAKFLEERQRDAVLKVLLIVNPTEDLAGAEKEGTRLEKILRTLGLAQVKILKHADATRDNILSEFGSGKYDVVHYAGHAFFDPLNRGRSGLICAGPGPMDGLSVLTGRDLASMSHLPSLVFFNACESGRIRGLPVPTNPVGRRNSGSRKRNSLPGDRSAQQAGICEALLRGGISQFIGTYWPVEDESASIFARSLYEGLLQGNTVREAVLSGRRQIRDQGSPAELVNYVHFGDPSFVVKERTRGSS